MIRKITFPLTVLNIPEHVSKFHQLFLFFLFFLFFSLLIKPNPAYAAWSDGQAADVVLGQANFTSSGTGTTASTLNRPRKGWFDSNKGRLWVADDSNNRVLSYLNTDLIVSTTSTATVIPTMPEWVMIIFMILTGMMAVYKLKRIKISN